ncbi:MAG: hypothetical protein QM753_07520 [Thermomicrobiales bacterium]
MPADDLVELAEPVGVPRSAGTKYTPSAAPASTAQGGQPISLGYQTPAAAEASDDEALNSIRDLHVPLALLVCGFVGIMLWAYISEGGEVAAIVYSALTLATTSVKAAVIIAIALAIARSNDVSFGPVGRAVLKFAGIIAFADATAYWLDWLMEQAGLLPHGYTTIYAIALGIIITGVMIGFLCRMLFDMDHQETLLVGMLLGLLSWGLGFAMHWGIALGIAAATAPPQPSAPPVAVAGPAPTVPVPVPATPANAMDQLIEQRMTQKFAVHDAGSTTALRDTATGAVCGPVPLGRRHRRLVRHRGRPAASAGQDVR